MNLKHVHLERNTTDPDRVDLVFQFADPDSGASAFFHSDLPALEVSRRLHQLADNIDHLRSHGKPARLIMESVDEYERRIVPFGDLCGDCPRAELLDSCEWCHARNVELVDHKKVCGINTGPHS